MFVVEEFEVAGDAARRTYGILSVNPMSEPAHPQVPVDHSITFDHATFRYEGSETDALHDASFTVKQGETVALVGRRAEARPRPRAWFRASGT